MTLIVGFGHKARHGKDEAIKSIISAFGESHDIRKYGFGDALKAEVNEAARAAGGMKELFPSLPVLRRAGDRHFYIPPTVVYDPQAPMDDPLCPLGKQRSLLQWWGTEYRRAQDEDYWVNKTLAKIYEDKPQIALICDLRFPNEFGSIRRAGGYVIRVDRVGYISDVPQHYSERALDNARDLDWDYIIAAPDGRLDLLQSRAVNAFQFILDVYASL